jgi:uncharacterized protein YukE
MGMDVDQVENIGHQLKKQAQDIQGVINAVNGLIGQAESNWQGHDAQQFKSWWETQHRPALHNAMQAVDGLGQSAFNNASEQRSVSGH